MARADIDRGLLDSMLQAVVATDMEGRFTAWNHAAEVLLGWTKKEVLGRPMTEFISSAEIAEQTKAIQAVVQAGTPWQGEADVQTKGGRLLPVELSASAVRDEHGRITGLLGVLQDITWQKTQMRELQESQSLAHLGSWTWDPQTDETWWSAEMYRVFERDPAEGPAGIKDAMEFFTPESRGPLKQALERIADGGSYELELNVCLPGGAEKVVISRGEAVEGDGHKPVVLRGTVQDITERKQIELDLRERLKELRALNRMATEGANQSDLEGLLRVAVDVLEPALLHEGLWVRARVGDTEVTSSGRPPGGPALAASFDTALGAGSIEVQYRSTHPDQNQGPFLQEEQELLNTLADQLVTFVSRDHATTELQHRAQLLESVSQAVMATDLEGKITYWNKGAEKIYGWTQEEAIGRSVTDVTPSEVSEKQAKEIFSRLQKGESWTGEFRVRRKDGSSFWAMVHDAPLMDAQGQMVGIIGVSFDITEQREVQGRFLFQAQLLGAVGQAVTATDLEGKVTYWNKPAEALYGWTREEALGRPVAELLGEAYTEEPSPETADDATATSVDHWMTRKDGSRVLVNLATSSIVDNDGLRGFVAIGQNVTMRRAMQKQFQEVVQNAPYGIMRTRKDGTIILANPEVARIVGYGSVKELMDAGVSVGTFYADPEERDRLIQIVQRDGRVDDYDLRVRRKNGELDWVRVTMYPSAAGDAQLEGFIRDIADIRESERMRINAETQYRRVVENAPYGIARTRKDGTIVLANLEFARIVGYESVEELIEKVDNVSTIYGDPEDRVKMIEAMQREGRLDDYEVQVRRTDGSVRWIRATIYPSEAEDADLEAFMRDVTDLHEAEQERIEAANELADAVSYSDAILRSLPGVFYGLRQDGRFVRWNDNFLEVAGYSADEMATINALDLFEGDDKELIQSRIAKAFENGSSDADARMVRKDGTSIPYYFTGFRLDIGEEPLLIGVGMDMTERERAKEVEAQAVVLEEMAEFRANFLNMAAHELNTPLTPLALEIHLIQSEKAGALNETQRKAVGLLDRSLKRLQLLVQDMLDAARLQAGTLKVQSTVMDLRQVVDDAVQVYTAPAGEVGVRFRLDCPPRIEVFADQRRMEQVVFNLVSNAVRYSPDGGEVVVRAILTNDAVRVEVRDHGMGLTKEQIGRLFQPFTQVHDTAKVRGGTGLGLYITQGILEAQGGEVGVESDGPGKGSTFWFTVPVEVPANGPSEPSSEQDGAA